MESKPENEDEFLALNKAEEGDVQEEEDADEVEEAAEVLMTDMTLDDDMDKIRDPEPGPMWTYHIEAYPWHADDVNNEHFIRLMKLASFTSLTVRKKNVSQETQDKDKLAERQRKGTLHLYAESYQTAKSILRHSTWKNMMSKELTFEITKRSLDTGSIMTVRMDVDTGIMCRVKFRDKAKGSFKSRTAKVSNLPREVTRDILDTVFCRSYVAYNGPDMESNKEAKEINPQQTLAEIPNFNGSLDVDCLNRSSCRGLVLALRSVTIMGSTLTIVANDSDTMVVPQETIAGLQNKEEQTKKKSMMTTATSGLTSFSVQSASSGRGREVREYNNNIGRTSTLTRVNSPGSHAAQSARLHPLMSAGRPRGMVTTQQPASASFTRSGQGMPVPMTGRQKMNEKIRRNHPNVVMGTPNTGNHPPIGASAGFRAANMKSMGNSFKQEIASLQSELERSTQAIEAKIERLLGESNYYSGYNEDMQMYVEGEWDEDDYDDYTVNQDESYFDDEQSSGYFNQGYTMPPPAPIHPSSSVYDATGYELLSSHDYEHHPNDPIMPLMAVRGVPRTRRISAAAAAAATSGMGRGLLRVPVQQSSGVMNNNNNVSSVSVRNAPQMRNMRGRGGSGGSGGGVIYHGQGSNSGYW